MSLPVALDGTVIKITVIILNSLTKACTLGFVPSSVASHLTRRRGLVRIGIDETLIFDVSLDCAIGKSFVGLFGFLHEHSLREELGQAILLIPLIVVGELDAGCNLLVALDCQFVVVGQMTFRADMGQKVRDVAESLLPGANTATEQLQRHDEPNGSKEAANGGESNDCRELQGNGKEHCTSTVPRKEKRRQDEESRLQSQCRRNSSGQERIASPSNSS